MTDSLPTTVPQDARRVIVRAPPAQPESGPDARERGLRLARLAGPDELRSALLALLLTPGSHREHAVWQAESGELPNARELLADVQALAQPERMPWFERLAKRVAPAPLGQRQALSEAARRLMAADGIVGPLDRLRWLALRHWLGEGATAAPAAAEGDLAALPAHTRAAIATFSAFLSRLVPEPESVPAIDLLLDAPGAVWYTAVTAPWLAPAALPPRETADADATLRALRGVQAVPWMLRPVLVRTWFDVARALTDGVVLQADAADALRLACSLLDVPLPPELTRQFAEPN